MAIKGLDQGYKISEVCEKYNIPRSSLKDHIVGISKGRKLDSKTILSMDKEVKLCDYIELMGKWRHPMTSTQLKAKMAEITQDRMTTFKNEVLGDL